MKLIQIFILGFIVLLAAAHAAEASADSEVAPAIDVDSLTAPIRLEGETASASAAKITNDRWIFLLYINGTPAAMADVKREGESWKAQVLETPQELRSAVRLYHASIGNLGMARKELEAAQKILLDYNSSRTRERDCLEALGLKLRPCSDYDSCLKSCFMSPEFCQPLAQANGKKFIDMISAYQNDSFGLTAAIGRSVEAYKTAWDKVDSTSVARFNATLPAIWSYSAKMLSHPLSGPLCQKPFYDSAARPGIQMRLEKALEWIEPVEDGEVEAQRLMEVMSSRKSLKLTEAAQKRANADVIGLSLGGIVWPKLESWMIALAGFALVIGLIGLIVWRSVGKVRREGKGNGS